MVLHKKTYREILMWIKRKNFHRYINIIKQLDVAVLGDVDMCKSPFLPEISRKIDMDNYVNQV